MKFKISIQAFSIAFLLLVAAQCPVFGQDPSLYIPSAAERTDAISHLKQLSEGVLIVRLNSNNRKMKELERLINSPDVNEKAKNRFQKMLETTKEETRQESLDLMQAFDGNYSFSKVLFMYDTAALQLKNGVKQGYFLNRELKPDPTLRLENDDWLMVYFRHESPALFVLLDRKFDQIQRPFPIPRRPVFKTYNQGLYFARDPLAGQWYRQKPDTTSGFVLFMSYSRKKQFKYFSVLLSVWNKDLTKSLERLAEDENK
jgi:hypothetical protein